MPSPWARDVCIGLALGWLLSVGALLAALHGGVGLKDLLAHVQPIISDGGGEDHFGCSACPHKEQFKCALFFECVGKLLESGTAPQGKVYHTSFVVFGRVNLCGMQMIGGGMFGKWGAENGCLPRLAEQNGTFVSRYMPALVSVAEIVHPTVPRPEMAAPQPRRGTHVVEPPAPPFSYSARKVAGERRVTLPRKGSEEQLTGHTRQLTAHSVIMAELGRLADDDLMLPDGNPLAGHTCVAFNGVPATATLAAAMLEQASGLAEVTLSLEFQPSEDDVRARGPDEYNPYTPPAQRVRTQNVLRTRRGYEEWSAAMRQHFVSEASPPGGLAVKVSHEDPLIVTLDNFISADIAAQLIGAATPRMRRATVSGAGGGAGGERAPKHSDSANEVHPGRTGKQAWLEHSSSPAVSELIEHLAELVGLPASHAEPLQVVKYNTGDSYKMHWDAYDTHTELGRHQMNNSMIGDAGQRLVTVLGYLSDVTTGGATEFQHRRTRILPKLGRVVVFHNCYPGTATKHTDALHAGASVGPASEKYIFNLWFHERPLRILPDNGK